MNPSRRNDRDTKVQAFQVALWPDWSHTPSDVVVVDNIEDALLRALEFSKRSSGTVCVRDGEDFLGWVLVIQTRVYHTPGMWYNPRTQALDPFHKNLLRVLYPYDSNLTPLW